MDDWATQQIKTIGLNGGWFVAYDDIFCTWMTTIYVSARFFSHHKKHGLIGNISLTCITSWDCIG